MSSSNSPRFRQRASDDSDSDMSTRDSNSSRSTVPSSVPSLEQHYSSAESKFGSPCESEDFDYNPSFYSPRDTVDTYCSTIASFDEFVEDDYPYYEHGHATYNAPKEPSQTQAIPAIPSEFAELFPSTRRLTIQHDDSTIDGNMNLRVDTNVAAAGEPSKNLTLFHLRMYDLKARDFSLRRYGRDCGREVAHIKRKVVKPAPQRPTLQRSLSKAFESFRGKAEAEQQPQFKLNRQDSGYSSSGFDEEEDEPKESSNQHPAQATNSNACTLEFSNYAHVDLTRRGGKASKKYDFEYWGKSYSWKRVIHRAIGGTEEVIYQLFNNGTNNVVASIVPDVLSPARAEAEEAKGGFIPPSSFVFRDSVQDPVIACLADVADVIVATGLTALVDDCIKRKFHKKKTVHMVLPIPMVSSPLKMKMEYVGPRRLIDEVFNRRPALSRSQSIQSNRSPTPAPVRTRTS